MASELDALARHVEIFGVLETAQLSGGGPTPRPDPFDARWGTDTETSVPATRAELPPSVEANAVVYVPTRSALARHALRALPIDPSAFTFVDVGSGKGRVVLLASELPFRAVIGVEPSPLHHATAESNLERFRAAGGSVRAADVTFQLVDVTDYALPTEPLVLFLYNPFQEIVARLFVMALDASLRAHPRDVWLVYAQPVIGERALATSTEMRLVEERVCLAEEYRVHVYRSRSR